MPTEPIIYDTPFIPSGELNLGIDFALPDLNSFESSFKEDGTPNIESIPFEDRFKQFININKVEQAPIRELGYEESIRYRDPNVPITATTDLEETYAIDKPTTWFGEQGALPKLYETWTTNLFSSTQTFFSGLKAISNGGDLSSLIDNDYTQQLAENTKRMEEMRPLYQTKDQMEHPFRYRNLGNTIKQAVPSGGTALSAMVEMAAMEAIFIAAGEAVGGPFGGGAGAIGGIVRNFAALPKYIKAIRSSANSSKEAFKAISQVAKRLNGVTNMTRPAISGAKYVGTSLYAANGEAALEAVMSAEEFVESEIRLFMLANNGRGPNQTELDEIKRRAAKVRDTTYGINLATLTASNMIQFPSILKGRWAGLSAPRFLQAMGARPSTGIMKTLKKGAKDKAGEAIDTMGGLKLKKTNFASTLLRFEGRHGLKPAGFLPDFGTDFFAEGAEEFLQGVASDYASRKYASPNAAGEKQFKSFWDIAVERAGTTEGQLEFVAGGIIGGGMSFGPSAFSNVNDVIGYNSKVDKINSATESLKTQLRQSLEAGGAIENILQTGNKRTISNNDDKLSRALKSAIHDLAAGHHSRNTVGIAMDQLDMLRDMDLDSFNELLGIQGSENSANELQKENLLNFVSDQFEASSASLEAVYKWGEANPLREDSYFKRVFSQLPLFNMFFRSKANLEDQVWDTLKQDLSRYQVNVNIYEDEVGDVLDRLDEAAEGSDLKSGITGFHDSIRSLFTGQGNTSPLKIVENLVSNVKERITDTSKVEGIVDKKEEELLEEIKDESDPMKAFMKILDTYSVTDEYKKEINNLMYGATARYVFAQKAESLTYLEGVKTRAKEIVGMMVSRYSDTIDTTEIPVDPDYRDFEDEEEVKEEKPPSEMEKELEEDSPVATKGEPEKVDPEEVTSKRAETKVSTLEISKDEEEFGKLMGQESISFDGKKISLLFFFGEKIDTRENDELKSLGEYDNLVDLLVNSDEMDNLAKSSEGGVYVNYEGDTFRLAFYKVGEKNMLDIYHQKKEESKEDGVKEVGIIKVDADNSLLGVDQQEDLKSKVTKEDVVDAEEQSSKTIQKDNPKKASFNDKLMRPNKLTSVFKIVDKDGNTIFAPMIDLNSSFNSAKGKFDLPTMRQLVKEFGSKALTFFVGVEGANILQIISDPETKIYTIDLDDSRKSDITQLKNLGFFNKAAEYMSHGGQFETILDADLNNLSLDDENKIMSHYYNSMGANTGDVLSMDKSNYSEFRSAVIEAFATNQEKRSKSFSERIEQFSEGKDLSNEQKKLLLEAQKKNNIELC